MDYSLLIGVVRRHFEVRSGDACPEAVLGRNSMAGASAPACETSGLYSTPRLSQSLYENPDSGVAFQTFQDGMHADVVEVPGTYYIGLIDVLQEWNFAKKLERFYKVYILGNDRLGISTIEPVQYRSRFLQRVIVDVFEGLDSVEESRPSARDFKTLEDASPSEGIIHC
jgi:hypothetical protein